MDAGSPESAQPSSPWSLSPSVPRVPSCPFLRILGDAQFVELAIEAGDADAQVLGGLGLVVVVPAQAVEDVLALELPQGLLEVLADLVGDVPVAKGRSSTPICRPSAKITARSMTFSSSRTLPRHSWLSMARMAPLVMPVTCLFSRVVYLSRK